MIQITRPASKKAARNAVIGASTRATCDTSARGESSSRMSAPAQAHHGEADLVPGPLHGRPRRAELAGVDHGDAVADLEQLVEVLADDEDGRALLGEIDESLADQPRRAGV